jgi:hypothetical protein
MGGWLSGGGLNAGSLLNGSTGFAGSPLDVLMVGYAGQDCLWY